MSLFAISDTHNREKANLLATKSPTFGSHSSANGHVPHVVMFIGGFLVECIIEVFSHVWFIRH